MGFSRRSRRADAPSGDAGGGVSEGWREAVAEAAGEALAAKVSERIFAVGGQAAAYVDGELVVDAAAGVTGSGEPMRPDHLHPGFCMLKPLPFLVLAAVAEEAGFGPDDPLEEMAGLPDWCPGGLTVRSLGSHEAGLGKPPFAQWASTRPSDRPGLLARAGRDRDRDPAYSDFAAVLVAECAVEQLADRDAQVHQLRAGLLAARHRAVDRRPPRPPRHRLVPHRPRQGAPTPVGTLCVYMRFLPDPHSSEHRFSSPAPAYWGFTS